MTNAASILSCFDQGVRFWLKARPGTQQQRPIRIVALPEDKWALEVSVSAIAEDGKANKDLILRLAKETKIKKNNILIKAGTTGRLKLVEVQGPMPATYDSLSLWLGTLG